MIRSGATAVKTVRNMSVGRAALEECDMTFPPYHVDGGLVYGVTEIVCEVQEFEGLILLAVTGASGSPRKRPILRYSSAERLQFRASHAR